VTLRNGPANRSCAMNVSFGGTGWEWKTVTFPPCTDGTWNVDYTVGMTVMFCFAVGTTYQVPSPGVWANGNYIGTAQTTNFFASVNNAVYVGNVQVYPGTAAPPASKSGYLQRPFDQELITCKRYFQKVGFPYVALPQDTNTNAQWNSNFVTTGLLGVTVPLPVELRTNPTVTFYRGGNGTANGLWSYYNGSAWVNSTSTVVNQPGPVWLNAFLGGSFGAGLSYVIEGGAKLDARI